jgi:hypothetical protein
MNRDARTKAANAIRSRTGLSFDPTHLGYSAEGTYQDTGEKWIECYAETDHGYLWVRVVCEFGDWVVGIVVGNDGQEVTR